MSGIRKSPAESTPTWPGRWPTPLNKYEDHCHICHENWAVRVSILAWNAEHGCSATWLLQARGAQTAVGQGVVAGATASPIDLCRSNRHYERSNDGRSEPVIKERRRDGRRRAFLVTLSSVTMSSSRLSGRPFAKAALQWPQTRSSGLRSGAYAGKRSTRRHGWLARKA